MTTLNMKFPLLTDLEQLEYSDTIAQLFLCEEEVDQTIVQKINDAYDAGAIVNQNGKDVFCIEIKTEDEYQVILNEMTIHRDSIAYETSFNPYDIASAIDKRIVVLTNIISRLGLFRLGDAPINALCDGMGTVIRRY